MTGPGSFPDDVENGASVGQAAEQRLADPIAGPDAPRSDDDVLRGGPQPPRASPSRRRPRNGARWPSSVIARAFRPSEITIWTSYFPSWRAEASDGVEPPLRKSFAGLRVENVVRSIDRPGFNAQCARDVLDERGGQLRPDAPLGVFVNASDRRVEPGLQVPGPLAVAPGDEDAVALDGLKRRVPLRDDLQSALASPLRRRYFK